MSQLEEVLAFQLKAAKIKPPVREYQFYSKRKWRSDFVWPDDKLIVEVEGAIHARGRHVRSTGFIKDCEKYNHAVLLGYRVLRVTGEHITSGEALEWIEMALNNELTIKLMHTDH